MIRRPPRSTPLYSSAASDVYKRQVEDCDECGEVEQRETRTTKQHHEYLKKLIVHVIRGQLDWSVGSKVEERVAPEIEEQSIKINHSHHINGKGHKHSAVISSAPRIITSIYSYPWGKPME
eukprot:TRINITY_DN4580_c0_g1_i3.p2 TRINITY_DN4580_c0_g1~~TRINITY_DN4580_c0_g1_i3.p2  ORF type:complete len:128 (+),score=14.68 TRINITY_DN4580_c0_g1_i3:24-386(+)